MSTFTMRDMLEAGIHFGHQTRFWNPKMAPYIFGVRHKIHIINLEKAKPLFQDAINFISKVAANNGKVLFVGTKNSAQNIIREEAVRCGMPYVDHRWLGGMLTNYKTVRQSIKKLKDLEALRDSKKLEGFTKKEALNFMRALDKLEHSLGGIKNMGGIPDIIFVVDVGYEKNAVAEANKLSIPVVGVVDTNNDPDAIDYIVPGNDDAIRSIRFYAKNIADTIIDARATIVAAKKAAEAAAEKKVIKEVKPKKKPEVKKVTIKKEAVKDAESEVKKEEPVVKEEAEKKPKTVKVTKAKEEVEPKEKIEAVKKPAAKKPAAKKPAAKKPAVKKTAVTAKKDK